MKMKKSQNKSAVLKTVPGQCYFCRSSEEDEIKFGKKYTKNGICVHYFCMLFASGLSQRGSTDNDGILGFLLPDIKKEARRAARLRCTYCKHVTATIGCVKAKCRACFHFGCGVDNGALNQFFDNFASYCFDHRPYQQVPLWELKKKRSQKTKCIICMSTVYAEPLPDTMRTPCCKANSWYHKDCLQRMASCSGLHFFKCPLCNNKDVFQKEMLEFGIYIPDRDAAWELEPNAFQELLERHNRCDIGDCKCPEGRNHSVKETQWEIVLCDTCGHMGCHLQCAGLASPTDEWVCHECQEIAARSTSSPAVLTPAELGNEPPKPAKRRGRPKGATSGYKRKRSKGTSATREAKQVRLSTSGVHENATPHALSPNRSKENYDDQIVLQTSLPKMTRVASRKTVDAAKIKSTIRPKSKDLRYYVLGGSNAKSGSSDFIHNQTKRNVSLNRSQTVRTGASLRGDGHRSRSDNPAAGSSSDSSNARAQRALQRGRRDDEGRLIPTDNMPNWLRSRHNQDAFVGRNLGVKLLSLTPQHHTGRSSAALPTAPDNADTSTQEGLQRSARAGRLTRSQGSSAAIMPEFQSAGDKPQWLTSLLREDFLTGNNLGQKLSAASPGLHLAPGVNTHLQPTSRADGSPAPGGRGKHCSSFPSGRPGSLPLGHGATFQTQVSGSELDNKKTMSTAPNNAVRGRPKKYPVSTSEAPKSDDLEKRKHMKYWDFVQHLEDIGAAPAQSSFIVRLSLYQQYLDGEFQLLSFADVKYAKVHDSDDSGSHSPTHSLVSPNDIQDAVSVSSDPGSPDYQDRATPPLNPFSSEHLQSLPVNSPKTYSISQPDDPYSPSPSMTNPYSPSQSCIALRTPVTQPALPYDEMPSSPEENYDDVLLSDVAPMASPAVEESGCGDSIPGRAAAHGPDVVRDPAEPPQDSMDAQLADSAEPKLNTDHTTLISVKPAGSQPIASTEPPQSADHAKEHPAEPIGPQRNTTPQNAGPQAVDNAEPDVVDDAEPDVVDNAGPDAVDNAKPDVVDNTESDAVDNAEPGDNAEPNAIDNMEPDVVDITDPVDNAEPNAVDNAEPNKVDNVDAVVITEPVDKAEPNAVNIVEPDAVDNAEPDAVDIAELETVVHAKPQVEKLQLVDGTGPKPVDPTETQTVAPTDEQLAVPTVAKLIDPKPGGSTATPQNVEPAEVELLPSTEPPQNTRHLETELVSPKPQRKMKLLGPKSKRRQIEVTPNVTPSVPCTSEEEVPVEPRVKELQPVDGATPKPADPTETQAIAPVDKQLPVVADLEQIDPKPGVSTVSLQNVEPADMQLLGSTEPSQKTGHSETQLVNPKRRWKMRLMGPKSKRRYVETTRPVTSSTSHTLKEDVHAEPQVKKLQPVDGTETKPADRAGTQTVAPTEEQLTVPTNFELIDTSPRGSTVPLQNVDVANIKHLDSTEPPHNARHSETPLVSSEPRRKMKLLGPRSKRRHTEGTQHAPPIAPCSTEEDDCIIIQIEDVRTLRASDPHHIDIEEIATQPGSGAHRLSQKTPRRPIVIRPDEISTYPGTSLIDLTDEYDDNQLAAVVLPTKTTRCTDCGKLRKKTSKITKKAVGTAVKAM